MCHWLLFHIVKALDTKKTSKTRLEKIIYYHKIKKMKKKKWKKPKIQNLTLEQKINFLALQLADFAKEMTEMRENYFKFNNQKNNN